MTDQSAAEGAEGPHEVLVVGGGVAGLTAAIYTGRAGFETTVVDGDRSILRRNAHLENYPGFPAGVNARLFLDMTRDQARRAGCRFRDGHVTDVERGESGDGFRISLADGDRVRAERVVAASWSDPSYLDGLDVEREARGSKTFVQAAPDGHTGVEGLYAAGRLADRYHQTAVAAGDGARAAITLIHDSDRAFYHDWVAPAGYFTDRGRDLPPGCEEIDEAERRRRERESMSVMRSYFAEPHPSHQPTHPSLRDEE